jgi:hypothetical protein
MAVPLVALGVPGALAAVLIAVVAFVVVLGVCFVVLRLLSFVLGADQDHGDSDPAAEPPRSGADEVEPADHP